MFHIVHVNVWVFTVQFILLCHVACSLTFDMAQNKNETIFETDFSSPSLPPELKWFEEPQNYQTAARDGKGLRLEMDPQTDFWKRTYYEPPLLKDNGHILYMPMTNEKVLVETTFEIDPQKQFDQGGLIVRIDGDHWIKTGIEAYDGIRSISCVTTNTYSDWSTQLWPSNKLAIRLYKLNTDYVVEILDPVSSLWRFIRIAHLHVDPDAEVMLGLYAAAPTDKGGSVHFNYLKYSHTEGIEHDNKYI